MCLIALSTSSGEFLGPDNMCSAEVTNPNGYGAMWIERDSKGHNRVIIEHSMDAMPMPNDLSTMFAGHWRYATVGAVNMENCHPFSILDKDEGDPCDLAVMFNGTLRQYDISTEHSDTAIWAQVLRKKLLGYGDLVLAELSHPLSDFWCGVSAEVGGNYALFLGSDIGFRAVPEFQDWHGEEVGSGQVMCSNQYSLAAAGWTRENKNNYAPTEKDYTWVKGADGTWSRVYDDEISSCGRYEEYMDPLLDEYSEGPCDRVRDGEGDDWEETRYDWKKFLKARKLRDAKTWVHLNGSEGGK